MSREFGSYNPGYFHTQIETAAYDCLQGTDALTRLWGKFFETFYPVAYAIASSEAGDSGTSHPIVENIRQMKALEEALKDIRGYLKPFEDVMEGAVEDYLRGEKLGIGK